MNRTPLPTFTLDRAGFAVDVAAIIAQLEAHPRPRSQPKTDEQFDADEFAFENGERPL